MIGTGGKALARMCAAMLVALATASGNGACALAQGMGTSAAERVTQEATARGIALGAGAGALASALVSRAQAQTPPLRAADETGSGVAIRLVDAESGMPEPQGDASLAGATIEFRDAGGSVAATATTAEDGSAQVPRMPAGAYQVTQKTATKGYAKNASWSTSVTVRADGHVQAVGALDIPVRAQRSWVLLAKVDADTREATAQGDATLEGCEVTLYNGSAHAVTYGGRSCAPGEAVCVVATGSDGQGRTASGLPFGTYEARETRAPAGYAVNEGWSRTVTVARAGVVYDETGSGERRPKGYVVEDAEPLADPVIRGGVRISKADAATPDGASQGAATLSGATFEVTYEGVGTVVVSGATRERGDVVATITTGGGGVAETAADLLPFGTYSVRETSAPAGYLRDEGWSQAFEVREKGRLVDLTGDDRRCADEVVRGDLALTKVSAATGGPMAGVAFLVTSRTTGEAHVAVTDEAGSIDTAANTHTHATNANDRALRPDGTVDATLLDAGAGIWFGGAAATDARGALPYDDYEVAELACPANDGHRLRTLEARVDTDGARADIGTVVDEARERVATRLTMRQALADTGSGNDAPPTTVELTDDVALGHLVVGRAYTLVGTLHLRGADGSDQGPLVVAGAEVTSTVTFAAEDTEQVVPVSFSFDAAGLAGSTLVCFEELSSERDGVCATHADISDDDQAVRIPAISTELAGDGGSHELMAESEVVLTDAVSYAGLEPGASYTLEATLVDRATGEALKATDGSPLTFSVAFEAQGERGQTTVPMTVDASALAGRSLVCLERLVRDGETVATHADLGDAAQTVGFPKVRTSASVEGTSGRTAPASDNVTVTDTVTYEGLAAGQAYRLQATLVDRASGEAVSTGAADLTPETASGTATVSIPVDASSLAGRSLVVLEELVRASDGTKVAEHRDLADAAQTVRVCGIATVATDAASGTHTMAAAPGARVTDVVSWRGVEPGTELRIEGTLVDRETGEPVTGAGGNAITASATVTAERSTGSVELTFDLDASALAGRTIVCFERAYDAQGNVVATHEDLADEAQSVHVPTIATTLADSETREHVSHASGRRTLTDTVGYENLVPGTEYELAGTLHDRATGEALRDAEGNEVTAKAALTPEAASGTAEVTFEVDATDLAGRTVVAFEELTAEGHVVAAHADIADAAQAVSLPRIATTATVAGTGEHTAAATGDAMAIEDVVAYDNLVPGLSYTVTGTLHDRETGKPVKVDGKEITASATLTPEQATGTVTVTFEVADTKALAGRTVVAFEELSVAGTVVAEHADIDDEAQSVTLETPADIEIDTTLHVTGSDSHEVAALARASLTDTVSYAGLEPGKAYCLRGILMDRATGEPALVAASEGADVTATTTATTTPTPAAANALEGLPASATVWVEAGGSYHADLSCEHIRDLVGLRRTTAGAARAAGKTPCAHEGKAEAQTTDPTPEAKTQGTGVTEGTAIAAVARLVPETSAGVAEVTFEFDASDLAGHDLVAFEELREEGEEGSLVATHRDLADADQTVRVRDDATSDDTKPTTSNSSSSTPTTAAQSGPLAGTGDATGPAPLVLCAMGCGLALAGMVALWRRRAGHTGGGRRDGR